MRRLILSLPLGALMAVSAYGQDAPPPHASVSVLYSALRANAGAGQCGCFFLQGGSAALALPLRGRFSAVALVAGQTASAVNGGAYGLSLLSVAAGPRFSLARPRDAGKARVTPFIQTLAGFSHGFGSFFPTTPPSASANAFTFQAGGGLDLRVTRSIAFRPAQVDFVFNNFPNGSNGRQNNLRLSAGVVASFR